MEKPDACLEVPFLHCNAQVRQRSGPYPEGQIHRQVEEQKLLVQDPTYIRTVQRTADVDGQKQPVVLKQRVPPWWKVDPSGQIIMSIKFGSKPIEFEKGKAGIAVPSKDKLPAVIDTLIAAVRAGELDELFTQASKFRPIPKSKKAA